MSTLRKVLAFIFSDLSTLFRVFIGLTTVVMTPFYVYKYLPEFLKLIPDLLNTTMGKFVGASIVMLLGYFLFRLKKNQQFWYGLFETIFALYSCFLTLAFLQKNFINHSLELASLAAVLTTLYLVVRGMTNIDDGRKKDFYLKNVFTEFFKRKSTTIFIKISVLLFIPIVITLISAFIYESFFKVIVFTIFYPIAFVQQCILWYREYKKQA